MEADKVYFFFSGWEPILRILVVGTLTYISILFLLKFSGKRTLARMTGFDFLVTVAMGAAFGSILAAPSISFSEAFTIFFLLMLLQYVFSFLETRSKSFKRIVTAPPALLFHNGEFLKKNMKKVRVGKDEIIDEVRKKGFSDLNEVEVVIFERDGSFSVLKKVNSAQILTYKQLVENEE